MKLNAYLHYGYDPTLPRSDGGLLRGVGDAITEAPRPLDNIGDAVLEVKDIFHALLRKAGDGPHIVPLSGGLDSRVVLAGLLDSCERENLVAVTFGSPGSLDYEIGSQVATAADVEHRQVNLARLPLKFSDLVEAARPRSHSWTRLLDAYYNRLVLEEFEPGAVSWTGFLGGELAGAHIPRAHMRSWDEAQEAFSRWNIACRSVRLTHPDFEATTCLPESPLLDAGLVCFEDQLDIGVRQENCIRPIVAPRDSHCISPFTHPRMIQLLLNRPREERHGLTYYRRLIKAFDPDLFSIPVKNDYGARLSDSPFRVGTRRRVYKLRDFLQKRTPWVPWNLNPLVNYIDFDEAFRKRSDFAALRDEAIGVLHEYNIAPWVDYSAIIERHVRCFRNHGDALKLLVSLAAYVRAEANGRM